MNPAAAITLAAVMIIAGILGCYILWPTHPRHARLFADPADTTDPDGEQFLHELHGAPPPGSYDNSPAAAARLLAALRGWAVRRPDDTQPIPHAVGTWGMPAAELADQLARQYLEVTR
jgi:hypothetical protein